MEVHIASFVSKPDKSYVNNPGIYFGGALRPPEDCYDVANGVYIAGIREKINNI